jgi:hypothetical protein
MTRNESLENGYPGFGADILSSIGRVGNAGRSRDSLKIKTQQARHRQLMDAIQLILAHRRRQ